MAPGQQWPHRIGSNFYDDGWCVLPVHSEKKKVIKKEASFS
jgi:hypothetical protein